MICNGFELSDFGKSMSAVSVGVDESRISRQVRSPASDLMDESCSPGGTATASSRF